MKIKHSAVAGTLESSDVQVQVFPQDEGLVIEVESSVMNQYGRKIKETVEAVLQRLSVTDGRIVVIDKGALDWTLQARVECALYRSCDKSEKNIPWGGAIR